MSHCEFSDLPAEQCACEHCRPDLRETTGGFVVVARFEARYDGACANGCRIRAGDQIGRTEEGAYACETCSQEAIS
jgi:hypothetical protein